ncbi:MAG: hypothetical protein ACOYBL_06900 [Lachnospiraceae bacterium]|jgi:hypothetical protein
MRRLKKLCMSLLLLSVMVVMGSQTVLAAEDYTYTVKVYAGNPEIGKLTGAGVTVTSGSSASVDPSPSGDCVVVSGLKYGDMVYIRPQDAAETVDARYYVRGITPAGREESEKIEGTFEVTGDRDYVIAYGIKGDMVAYTVNYLDAAGNQLLASDTYYGNPGERQYVSSRYVDGYVPQAYNLVKTLSTNEAENVFDFRYTPETAVTTPPTGTTGTDAGAGTGTGAAGTGTDAGTGTAAGAGADAGAAAEPEAEDGTGEDEIIEAEDEETPQALVDLDDEEVPLANVKEDRPGTVMSHMPIYVGVGAVAVLALVVTAVYLNIRRKRS